MDTIKSDSVDLNVPANEILLAIVDLCGDSRKHSESAYLWFISKNREIGSFLNCCDVCFPTFHNSVILSKVVATLTDKAPLSQVNVERASKLNARARDLVLGK